MEQWEIGLRQKLEFEIPEGFYNISTDTSFIMGTNKQGYINYKVALQREINKMHVPKDKPQG